jgi:hypothetical protein
MPETAETTTDPTDIGPYFWLTLVCSTGELAQHMGCDPTREAVEAGCYLGLIRDFGAIERIEVVE